MINDQQDMEEDAKRKAEYLIRYGYVDDDVDVTELTKKILEKSSENE